MNPDTSTYRIGRAALRLCAVVAAMCIGLGARAQENLKINKISLSSIRPISFTSMAATVTVNVTSTREKTTVSNISGIVYAKDGKAFTIRGTQDVVISPGTGNVSVSGEGTIAEGTDLMSIIKNLSLDPSNYTADITCIVKTGNEPPHKVTAKGVSMGAIKK